MKVTTPLLRAEISSQRASPMKAAPPKSRVAINKPFGQRHERSSAGGPGAVVHYVDDPRGSAGDLANHSLREGYLRQRVSVADALAGNFNDVQTK